MMIGTPAVAVFVALWGFWLLLAIGLLRGELGSRGSALFVLLWMLGLFGLPHVPYGASLFSPYVAILDIGLVFVIFRGDVRLT
jgi:hypothetical protein